MNCIVYLARNERWHVIKIWALLITISYFKYHLNYFWILFKNGTTLSFIAWYYRPTVDFQKNIWEMYTVYCKFDSWFCHAIFICWYGYASETCLMVQKKILRRIFGPQRDENEEWRLYKEELHGFYRSTNVQLILLNVPFFLLNTQLNSDYTLISHEINFKKSVLWDET